MNTVEPIRDMYLVTEISRYLREKSERDYLMFRFGIYTGLRISDILKLRVMDVRGRDSVKIREIKTGKERSFKLNKDLRKDIARFIEDRYDYEYLFRTARGRNKPITRVQAYRILNQAGKVFGLDSIGTHTLRKTFGYHYYRKTKDITTLQKIFNHASPWITMRYIGATQDVLDNAMDTLHFNH